MDITTVTDDSAVLHDGTTVHRFTGLAPATDHHLLGQRVTTLPRPLGPLTSRVATVNDLHFGEIECGRLGDEPTGPILRVAPGDLPYPVVMNSGAAAEIAAIEPDAVVAKGDVTSESSDEEWAAFERCYRDRFGDRLHVVRGNHDLRTDREVYAGDAWVELAGVALALLDTTAPGCVEGVITTTQLDWLDAHTASSTVPVIVMGHHPPRLDDTLMPDLYWLRPESEAGLAAVVARHRAIVAYTAGHTHRHRVRPIADGVPAIEVGCVKDFPGTWAEYRVHTDAIVQVVHRISDPAALAWSEQCRGLYRGVGIDYAEYALGDIRDRCLVIPLRG